MEEEEEEVKRVTIKLSCGCSSEINGTL